MPCRTEEPYEVKPKKPMETVHGLEAALCGILTELKGNYPFEYARILPNLDYREMGITEDELMEWWGTHMAKDEARRKREQEARMRETAKNAALAKLTKEERAILGLR